MYYEFRQNAVVKHLVSNDASSLDTRWQKMQNLVKLIITGYNLFIIKLNLRLLN